jgi:hypothetical protein
MWRFEILDDKLDIARLSNQSLRQEPTAPCARQSREVPGHNSRKPDRAED